MPTNLAPGERSVVILQARELLFEVLKEQGIRYVFGVEGTTELPLIDGCAERQGVRYVQTLHENIAVGAAMGYGRMTGKPGVAILHVTPGLAHGLGNLYNAWRARIPLVVICGNQSSKLATQEPILVSDLTTLARQYTKWSHELRNVDELPIVLQRAFKEAATAPAGPVFLSMPVDLTIQETDLKALPTTRVATRMRGDLDAIHEAAALLATASKPALVAGDGCGLSGAWEEMKALAELVGAPVYNESLSSLMNHDPADHHWQGELPGSAQAMHDALAAHDVVLFAGFSSQAPMTVYDGTVTLQPASVKKIYLHYDEWEIAKNAYGDVAILGDVRTSLTPLVEAVRTDPRRDPAAAAQRNAALRTSREQTEEAWRAYAREYSEKETLSAGIVAVEMAKLARAPGSPLADFVFVDEANTCTSAFLGQMPFKDPHSYYSGRGVSLGYSMPSALGIRLGAPHRKIVNVVGDGASLFYPQAFWTAAKLGLPVLFVVLNNREYRTLQQGLQAMTSFWPHSAYPPGLRIERPDLDFVAIANAFHVPGRRVQHPKEVQPALEEALANEGPYLLEFVVDRGLYDAWPGGNAP